MIVEALLKCWWIKKTEGFVEVRGLGEANVLYWVDEVNGSLLRRQARKQWKV